MQSRTAGEEGGSKILISGSKNNSYRTTKYKDTICRFTRGFIWIYIDLCSINSFNGLLIMDLHKSKFNNFIEWTSEYGFT